MSLTSETTLTRWRGWAPAAARLLRWAPLTLALAGMGISAYLGFVHYSGVPLYCTGAGGCHTVQSSQYATLVGVPVSLLGFVLYAAIFAAGLLALRGSAAGDAAALLTFGMALSGVLYSGYLTWLELYRIYAICGWCVTSAGLLSGIFVLSGADVVLFARWRRLGQDEDG